MKTTRISTSLRGLILAAFICLLCTSALQSQTRFWINADGGTFVGTASDWDGGNIPTSSENVQFMAGTHPERDATYTLTLDDNYTFNTMDNAQGTVGNKVTMDLNGNTLTLNGLIVNRVGSLEFQNGTGSNASSFLSGYRGIANTTTTFTNANWTAGSSITVGEASVDGANTSNTQLIVQGGSTLTLNSTAGAFLGIGFRSGTGVSNNSKLTVTGTGSALNIAATSATVAVRVGNSVGTSGNSLEVLAGGSFTSTAVPGATWIGVNGDAATTNNTILVSGTDSGMSLGGAIEVGRTDNSGNTLTINNNADFTAAGNLHIRSGNPTNNGVLVASGATAEFNGATNQITGGFLTVDGGTVTANHLQLNNSNARVNFLAGSLSINGTLNIVGNNSRFLFDLGDGPLNIAATAFDSSVDNVFLDIDGLTSSGSYTLFAFDSSSGLVDSLQIGNITAGFESSFLEFNSGSVVLQAIPEPRAIGLLAFVLGFALLRLRRNRK